MQHVFELASSISTPLALAGFLAAAFFFIAKQLIDRDFFSRLTTQHSARLLTLIVNRLFLLSLVAMILGFLGYALTKIIPKPNPGSLSLSQFVVAKMAEGTA